MRHWLRLHRIALTGTLKLFLQNPLNAILNLMVIGIAVALPLGLYAGVDNLQNLSLRLPTEPQITVFLQPDTGTGDIARIKKRLEGLPGVTSVRHISKQTALDTLQGNSGMRELLAGLDGNPLPDAFAVQIKLLGDKEMDKLTLGIKSDPSVDTLQQDNDWAKRLGSLVALGHESVLTVSVLFGTALLLITANLVRMQILTRLDEIEVSKLIGATDSFIRRPFLYFATLQGLLGGAVGIGVVAVALARLSTPVEALATLYGEHFTLSLPNIYVLVITLGVVVLVSLMGAVLSVSRQLKVLGG